MTSKVGCPVPLRILPQRSNDTQVGAECCTRVFYRIDQMIPKLELMLPPRILPKRPNDTQVGAECCPRVFYRRDQTTSTISDVNNESSINHCRVKSSTPEGVSPKCAPCFPRVTFHSPRSHGQCCPRRYPASHWPDCTLSHPHIQDDRQETQSIATPVCSYPHT